MSEEKRTKASAAEGKTIVDSKTISGVKRLAVLNNTAQNQIGTNNTTIRIALYARKSKQTDSGDSIDVQINLCKDYIMRRFGTGCKVEIVEFRDEGYSGKNLKRPDFCRMMSTQNTAPFNYVVVYRLDRISRSVGDFAKLSEELVNRNTGLICIKEEFDTSSPMGRAMINIAAVFAQLERETIAERIKDNMYLLAKAGQWMGGTTPLGYMHFEHKIPLGGGKVHIYYTLTVDNTQIAIAKLIFAKYDELRSVSGVQTYLNDKGIKTQKDKPWNKSNVKRILTNPIYCIADADSLKYFTDLGCSIAFSADDMDGKCGIMSYNRTSGEKRNNNPPEMWLITIGEHEGILTGKEWVRIQHLLTINGREKYGGKTNSVVPHNDYALLSGVLRCKLCGKNMYPKKFPSGNVSYICSGKTSGNRCKCSNLPQPLADEIVCNKLLDKSKSGFAAKYVSAMKKAVANFDKDKAKRIRALQAEKQQNEAKIKNLVDTISSGIASAVTIQAINAQIDDIDKRNREIEIESADISTKKLEHEEITQKMKAAIEAMEYLAKHFKDLPVVNRRDYIKAVISSVEYDGKDLHIFARGSTD